MVPKFRSLVAPAGSGLDRFLDATHLGNEVAEQILNAVLSVAVDDGAPGARPAHVEEHDAVAEAGKVSRRTSWATAGLTRVSRSSLIVATVSAIAGREEFLAAVVDRSAAQHRRPDMKCSMIAPRIAGFSAAIRHRPGDGDEIAAEETPPTPPTANRPFGKR